MSSKWLANSGMRPIPSRALATGKSGYVALWVQTLSTSYYAQVAHAMEASLEKQGYQIVVTPFGRIDRNREGYLGAPAGVDGVIAQEIYGDIWPLLFRRSRHRVPVVTTGILAPPESRDHVHVVITDAAATAVNHLADTGRRRIAYAANGMTRGTQDSLYIVYHAVLARRGLAPELIDLPGADRASVRAALRD